MFSGAPLINGPGNGADLRYNVCVPVVPFCFAFRSIIQRNTCGRYPRYAVCVHGLPTIKRSSAGEERLPNLRDEHAVVTGRAHVSMQVRGRARNLHVLVRLQIGDIGLAIEPQCPVTTHSVSVAVFGCPMPRASIHTNLASQADVDVEGVMEPIGMEAHVNKAVLRFDFVWASATAGPSGTAG